MGIIYNIAIYLYQALLHISSLFNKKAKQWVVGRKEQVIPDLNNQKVIWMHCSSLGEFEQGKPVFEELKKEKTNYTFVLSFFSPSGYERLKNSNIANYILYLPIDLPSKVSRFVEKINPEISIFVKYDFWYNYLKVLNDNNRKVVFISVLLDEKHRLFNSFNSIISNQLKKITAIFTQDEKTVSVLKKNGYKNVRKAGDTRIDRVIELAKTEFKDSIIENFVDIDKKVLICGSTWESDIELLSNVKDILLEKYKLIIAPHEISKKQINYILDRFKPYKIGKYSTLKIVKDIDILIIDKIGILSRIYRYGNLAYIGGGFGKAIHNTLEPASYNIPVIIGPKYKRFNEAVKLVDKNSFFSVTNESEFKEVLQSLDNMDVYENAVLGIKSFINQNKGASLKVVSYIKAQIKD